MTRRFILLALLLPACNGAQTDGTEDEAETETTAGQDGGIEKAYAECFGVSFVEGVAAPEYGRGIGSEDDVCQRVTNTLTPVSVSLSLQDPVTLATDARIILYAYEYDTNVADAAADCVEGTCADFDAGTLEWTFLLPGDAVPDMGYYITGRVDVDGDGMTANDCVDMFIDPVFFTAADFSAGVELVARVVGC